LQVKGNIMLIDLWHHWLLLRPLLVFALAGPLLVFAVLFRGRGRPGSVERQTDATPATPSAKPEAPIQRAPKELGVAATPRQWRVDSGGSDRRVA
jgi:hypothetical protein